MSRLAKPNSRPNHGAARALYQAATSTGDTDALIVNLTRLAECDDCDAMIILATLFREGLQDRNGNTIVRRDARAEARHVKRAAELGDANGMTALAGILLARGAQTKHFAKAARLYARAYRIGHAHAAFNLAVAYLNLGRHRRAVSWFQRAAARGDMSAVLQLAHAQIYGLGTRRNAAAATEKLLRLARTPRALTQFEREHALLLLANAHLDGWLVERNMPRALALLRRAASIGSSAANGLLEDLGH